MPLERARAHTHTQRGLVDTSAALILVPTHQTTGEVKTRATGTTTPCEREREGRGGRGREGCWREGGRGGRRRGV